MDLINMIGQMGFPIVATIAMALYVKYQSDRHREDYKNLNEQHQKEMVEVTTAINNNTIALTKLCERMDI